MRTYQRPGSIVEIVCHVNEKLSFSNFMHHLCWISMFFRTRAHYPRRAGRPPKLDWHSGRPVSSLTGSTSNSIEPC
jgi:hypothetical protein